MATILIALVACPLPAATIYIAQNSAGGNTGADCADARAIASLVGADWTAGNNIHLCGKITSTLVGQGSGSMGSPITVIFETGASITVPNCGTNGCIALNGLSWITVDGSPTSTPCGYVAQVDVACNGLITATNVGTGLSSFDSDGIYARGGTSHIEIRNLAITNMYVHNSNTDTGATGNYNAIWTDGSNNSFHNLIIHDAFADVKGEAGTNNTNINNSQLYNSNWNVALSGPATNTPDSITLVTIHDNDMHDWSNWDTTGDTYHHDGVIAAGNNNLANGVSHIDIYNNYLHGSMTVTANCSANCMTAPVFFNDGNNVRTFNNVIAPTSGQFVLNGLIFYWSPSTLNANDFILNNTVVCGTNSSNTGAGISIEGDASMTLQNNIFQGCNIWARVYGVTPATTFTSMTNQAYQDSSLTNHWEQCTNGTCSMNTTYSTLAAWQAAITSCCSGADTSAIAQTASFSLNGVFQPASGSAVVSAGANLTSLSITALDSDQIGSARPGGATAWTIGALNPATSVSSSKGFIGVW